MRRSLVFLGALVALGLAGPLPAAGANEPPFMPIEGMNATYEGYSDGKRVVVTDFYQGNTGEVAGPVIWIYEPDRLIAGDIRYIGDEPVVRLVKVSYETGCSIEILMTLEAGIQTMESKCSFGLSAEEVATVLARVKSAFLEIHQPTNYQPPEFTDAGDGGILD